MRQAHEHPVAGGALRERCDRRTVVDSDNQDSFPVPRNGAVFDLGGAFGDFHRRVPETGPRR